MASSSGGASTRTNYVEWAHEIAKPFQIFQKGLNNEIWNFNVDKGKALFEDFCHTCFSAPYWCFLDIEFGAGLDYMLGTEDGEDRPRFEKRDFGRNVISETKEPVYTQLYYACARLVYTTGEVKDLYFPWYLFQTTYKHGYHSRNSPCEKDMLNCMYLVFQHMLRNKNAIKILSYGEVDIRVSQRFFDAVRRANTDLFQDRVEYDLSGSVVKEIHDYATYEIPRERCFVSPKDDEAAAWSTLVDLGWKGETGTHRAKDIRDLKSKFLTGQSKYVDMKKLNGNSSLEKVCETKLGQQNIKSLISQNFSLIFFRLATMTWKYNMLLHPNEGPRYPYFKLLDADAGLRNAVDIHFATVFGESLSTYCAKDVHWIHELALKEPEKYFSEASPRASFAFPDSRSVSSTTVVVFDWLRADYAAAEEKLAKFIDDNSVPPNVIQHSSMPSSQSQQDHDERDPDSDWSGDERRNIGVVRSDGLKASNPYVIME
jgi:hypothetical protein